jgi:hypothetical protein
MLEYEADESDTDKQTRDQALDSLKAYLGAQTEISELDLLKLWKGLFYCTSTPPFRLSEPSD